jgi:hypothetical protein
MTHEEVSDKVAAQRIEPVARSATLTQMNTRLGTIETRLTSIDTRLDGKASNALVIGLTIGLGAWISLNMGLLAWLTR